MAEGWSYPENAYKADKIILPLTDSNNYFQISEDSKQKESLGTWLKTYESS